MDATAVMLMVWWPASMFALYLGRSGLAGRGWAVVRPYLRRIADRLVPPWARWESASRRGVLARRLEVGGLVAFGVYVVALLLLILAVKLGLVEERTR